MALMLQPQCSSAKRWVVDELCCKQHLRFRRAAVYPLVTAAECEQAGKNGCKIKLLANESQIQAKNGEKNSTRSTVVFFLKRLDYKITVAFLNNVKCSYFAGIILTALPSHLFDELFDASTFCFFRQMK